MLSSDELLNCRTADFSAFDGVADLRDVKIDAAMPIPERVESLIEQVKNPYLFKVGDVLVKVNYKGEKDLSQALETLLRGG